MKILMLAFWAIFLVAVFGLIPDPLGFVLISVGMLIFLAHAIEFLVFKKAISAKGDSGPKSFLMTMVYGIFYFKF